MSHENKPKTQSGLQVAQFQFTKSQHQALSNLLPQGYSLELRSKTKKDSSHRPSKKVFTNEGTAITKVATPVEEPPVIPVQPEATVAPATKRILRDKKQPKTYFEDKFLEPIPPIPTTSSKPVKPSAEATKKCANLLQRLKKHNCAGPFLYPVDVDGLGLYDYYDVIKEPMDLSTVDRKLKNNEYSSVFDFGSDIRKIWNNALTYNAEGSSIYNMTLRIKQYFEKIFKEIEDVQFSDKVKDLEEKVKNLTKALTELQRPGAMIMSATKPVKGGTKVTKSPGLVYEEPMSIQEKKVLCEDIKRLPPEALRGVWEIVSKGLPNNHRNNEELVFDIDILPVKITRELEKYVKSKIVHVKPSKSKPKELPAAKPAAKDHSYGGYNHNAAKPEVNGQRVQNMQQSAPFISNTGLLDGSKKEKKDDAESKSSDSSFISDSESGSEDERKPRGNAAQNYHLKQQELENFQAGAPGSMLNSFILK